MRASILSGICVIAVLSSLAGYSAENQSLPLGTTAPDFSLPGVDGKTYSMKDFASFKILAVVFTCNHCPASIAYEDRLIKLVDDYKQKGVGLIAINPNNPASVPLSEMGFTDVGDSFDDMKIRAAYKKFNFPYLFDGESEHAARAFGARMTPQVFVFDSEHKLRYAGRIDDNEREERVKVSDLRNALDDLLAGREVKVTETEAVGCLIEWREKESTVKDALEPPGRQRINEHERVNVELANETVLKTLRKNDTGKLRVVNFWSTECGPCVAEFKEFVKINQMYRDRAFELVTVAANDPDQKKEVLTFLLKHDATMRNLIFGETDQYKLMAAFDPDWDASLPYTMVIGLKSEVIKKINGPINPLELRRLIVGNLNKIELEKK